MFAELARRGLQHPNAAAFVKRSMSTQSPVESVEVPAWGVALFSVSFWASTVAIWLVAYMLQGVITTLCMVESPVAAITVSPSVHEPSTKEEEKDGLLETGPTITLVNQKPITASIRRTIRHLVDNAGRGARFRGFYIYFAYTMISAFVSTFFTAVLPHVPGQPILIAGLTGATLANLHATWTHKIVSMPTTKTFCARYRAASNWKFLALPAAIETAMPYISAYLTCGVGMLLGLHKFNPKEMPNWTADEAAGWFVSIIFSFAFLIAISIFLCLPATVTLVRMEASLLPEDEDTIVPFDRTFGGKVVSTLAGGSGKIGFLDAWKSFNWEARRRLIKLSIKSTLLVFGLMFIIAHVLVAEVFVVMGPELGKLISKAKAEGWTV